MRDENMAATPCEELEMSRPLVAGGQGRDGAGLVSDALVVALIDASIVFLIIACTR